MNTSLPDFYEHEILPRLTPDLVYTSPAHKWQQHGDKWKGGCPWHESKSGNSFYVERASLLWRCPSCERGGGPIQYLCWLRYGHGSPTGALYVDLVRELAQIAGVTMPEREQSEEQREAAQRTKTRQTLLDAVLSLTITTLWSDPGKAARAYLNERGFTDADIRDLRIGLYPTHKAVEAHLRRTGHDLAAAAAAGLLWQKLEGFILFPWSDASARPLTIYAKWQSKTLPLQRDHPGWRNDPNAVLDAPITKTLALPGEGTKASPLYFDRALRGGHRHIVAVEGVTDAALAQARGLTEVVAYVAASFSAAQIETLRQFNVQSVTIVPDPDGGGDNGALSCVKRLTDAGIASYVSERLPDGLDPDEFLERNGVEAFRELVRHAAPGYLHQSRCLLAKHDLTTDRGRLDATQAIAGYVATLSDPRHRSDVLKLAAQATGYAPDLLEAFVAMSLHCAKPTSRRREPAEWTEENWESWGEEAAGQELDEAEDRKWMWGRWYVGCPFPQGKKEEIAQRIHDKRWTTIRNYGTAVLSWQQIDRQGLNMSKCLALNAVPDEIKAEFAGRCFEKGLTVDNIRKELRSRRLLKPKDPKWWQMLRLTTKQQDALTNLILDEGSEAVVCRMQAAGLVPAHGRQFTDAEDPRPNAGARHTSRRREVVPTAPVEAHAEEERTGFWYDDPDDDSEESTAENDTPHDVVRSPEEAEKGENSPIVIPIEESHTTQTPPLDPPDENAALKEALLEALVSGEPVENGPLVKELQHRFGRTAHEICLIVYEMRDAGLIYTNRQNAKGEGCWQRRAAGRSDPPVPRYTGLPAVPV